MATNLVKNFPENHKIRWTNGTGAEVDSGEFVDAGYGHMVLALEAIAIAGSGMIATKGQAEIPATTGYTIAAGAIVYLDSADSNKPKAWTPGITELPVGRAVYGKATGDTVVTVNIGDLSPRRFETRRAVTAGEDTANAANVTHGLGAIPTFFSALIASTGNVIRVPQGAVTADATHVIIADSGLAVNETLIVQASL